MAAAVICARARGRFFNLVDLVNQLEQEKPSDAAAVWPKKLLRYDLIVIGDLGYERALTHTTMKGSLLVAKMGSLFKAN